MRQMKHEWQNKTDTCCVVLKPTQQHQARGAELSVLAQGQAGQVLVFRLYCESVTKIQKKIRPLKCNNKPF